MRGQINGAINKSRIKKILEENPDIVEEAYESRRKEDIDIISAAAVMLSMMVLEDVYGFGPTRLKRFADNYSEKIDSLEKGAFTLQDAVDYFQERGITVEW